MTITKEELAAREEKAQDEGFIKFVDDPMTRMGLSMLALDNEKMDMLNTVMRASFERGFQTGVGNATINFLEAVVGRKLRGGTDAR